MDLAETEEQLKKAKGKEKKELKLLVRDFYELKVLFKLIKDAEEEKSKGNNKEVESSIRKILRKLRGGITGSEERIERRMARNYSQMKGLVLGAEKYLAKIYPHEVQGINKLLSQAEVYNADLEKLGSRGGEIECKLKDAKKDPAKLDAAFEDLKSALMDVQSFEEVITQLLQKTKEILSKLEGMNFKNVGGAQYTTQAKIELFADSSYITKWSKEQRILLQNARQMSKSISFPNLPASFSAELRELMGIYQESYRRFEKEVDLNQVRLRAKMDRLYEQKFEKTIKKMKIPVGDKNFDPKKIEGYLGRGANGYAFMIDVGGKKYAAKFGSVAQLNMEVKELQKGKGVSNLSQLVTYSFEDSVTIMELLLGKNISEFNLDTQPRYTDAELAQLIGTIDKMSKKGLNLDPKASNFMYTPKKGFSILDYHIAQSRDSAGMTIISVIRALTCARYNNSYYTHFQIVDILSRILHILKKRFPLLFTEVLRLNNEAKLDSRSSSYGVGFFNKQNLLEWAKEDSKAFPDAKEKEEAVRSRVADIEALGFF